MKLLSLTMKNFMPYKGEAHVEFPTDDFRNVMLVFGDNMRGKTSFLNALRWGFYGRAIGRHSREILLTDILNTEAALEGDFTVEVHIRFTADGRAYDLRRKATKRSFVAWPQRPEDYLTQVYLATDGIPVQGDLVETEINQIAPEQVSRFFLFDGELLQEYETLLIEGSVQGRQIKDAIEQVLGVPSLVHGRDELGALLKAAQKVQARDLKHVNGLEQLAQNQAVLTERQDSIEQDLSGLRDRLEQVRRERTALDDELSQVESVHRSKARLDFLQESVGDTESLRNSKRAERRRVMATAWLDLIEVKVAPIRERLEDERQVAIQRIKQNSKVENRIAQLSASINTRLCPTCEQPVGEERRAQIGAELGQLQVEFDRLNHDTQDLDTISAHLGMLSKIRGVQARERIAQIDQEIQRHEVDIARNENEIERLRDEIQGYDTAEIARKRSARDEWVKEEGRLQNEIGTRADDLDRVKKELAVTQHSIEGESRARSQRSTVKVTVCSQLESVFSESIERLRDLLRQSVESRASEAFKKMTTQKAYQGLKINQNYGLVILDERGERVTVRSAGAEQVVALSLIDGLNRTGRATGPVVMDTPFGRLDLSHRDNILAYLPTVTTQFVLLVHSGEIRGASDLRSVTERVGASYRIREVNPRHSVIEREDPWQS